MNELEKCKIAKEKGFTYNEYTGQLFGIKGKEVKRKHLRGYIVATIKINNKIYEIRAHRLCWFLYYGKVPKNFIDHINGSRDDNRITNLRDVTNQENQFNQTKARGYRLDKRSGKYKARICLNKKEIHLGYFSTEQEAKEAYLQAKIKYHKIS